MNNQLKQFPTYLDDVPDGPIDAAAVLSDSALEAGGLVPITAFVRTRSSANANRLKKLRAKAEDAGLRQLNVVVPVAAHATVKAIAKALQAGTALHDVLEFELANAQSIEPATGVRPSRKQESAELERLARLLASWTGWRRAVAKWLGLL